jgi:hypothetical protein
MARPSHPPRLDYSNYTWRRVQITKLLIVLMRVTVLNIKNKNCKIGKIPRYYWCCEHLSLNTTQFSLLSICRHIPAFPSVITERFHFVKDHWSSELKSLWFRLTETPIRLVLLCFCLFGLRTKVKNETQISFMKWRLLHVSLSPVLVQLKRPLTFL